MSYKGSGRKETEREVKTKQGIKETSANPRSMKVEDKITERNKGSVKSKKNTEITTRKSVQGKAVCSRTGSFIQHLFLDMLEIQTEVQCVALALVQINSISGNQVRNLPEGQKSQAHRFG